MKKRHIIKQLESIMDSILKDANLPHTKGKTIRISEYLHLITNLVILLRRFNRLRNMSDIAVRIKIADSVLLPGDAAYHVINSARTPRITGKWNAGTIANPVHRGFRKRISIFEPHAESWRPQCEFDPGQQPS